MVGSDKTTKTYLFQTYTTNSKEKTDQVHYDRGSDKGSRVSMSEIIKALARDQR